MSFPFSLILNLFIGQSSVFEKPSTYINAARTKSGQEKSGNLAGKILPMPRAGIGRSRITKGGENERNAKKNVPGWPRANDLGSRWPTARPHFWAVACLRVNRLGCMLDISSCINGRLAQAEQPR
jgi:hypothetical protein